MLDRTLSDAINRADVEFNCFCVASACTAADSQYLVGEASGKATTLAQFIIVNIVF